MSANARAGAALFCVCFCALLFPTGCSDYGIGVSYDPLVLLWLHDQPSLEPGRGGTVRYSSCDEPYSMTLSYSEHAVEHLSGPAQYWRFWLMSDVSDEVFFWLSGGPVEPFLEFGLGLGEFLVYPSGAADEWVTSTTLGVVIGMRDGNSGRLQWFLQCRATVWLGLVAGGGSGPETPFGAGLDLSAGLDLWF